MNADDPRLAGYDLKSDVQDRSGGAVAAARAGDGHRRDRDLAAHAAGGADDPQDRACTPRAIVDQKVTVTASSAAAICSAICPTRPAQSRYDFVLRSADAAIWVTNIRPRGKGLRARARRAHRHRALARGHRHAAAGPRAAVAGRRGRQPQAHARPPTETTAGRDAPIRVPAAPPPEVVFSAPTQDETDVSMGDERPDSVFARHRPGHAQGPRHRAVPRLETRRTRRADTPTAEFTTQYCRRTRVLELKFTKPLERFRTVRIELLERDSRHRQTTAQALDTELRSRRRAVASAS